MQNLSPASRQEIETSIETLIDILDATDAPTEDMEHNGDLEDNADAEPSLGSRDGCETQQTWSAGNGGVHDDCEYAVDDGHEDDPCDHGENCEGANSPAPKFGIDQRRGLNIHTGKPGYNVDADPGFNRSPASAKL